MSLISHLCPLPLETLRVGLTLPFNIHILLPQNESVIHFRKVGDIVSEGDMTFYHKIPPAHLLLPIAEVNKLYEMMAANMGFALQNGEINSPIVKQTATEVLETFKSPANLDHLLKGVSSMVESLIAQFKKTPSVLAYDEALKRATERSSDLLSAHHEQVSSIAVLMGLSLGDLSLDDISDLAGAGLLHDLGLKEITQEISLGHLKGLKKVNPQEQTVYMRHIQLGLDRIKKEKISVTPGMQRIIELHHENWDGSGFRAYVGNRIFRPARILRIADDLVSLISDKSLNLGFKAALEKLNLDSQFYDPEILQFLLTKESASTA